MSFENLPPEFQEKAKDCKTVEELAALAEAVGVKLSDKELEDLAGGGGVFPPPRCPLDGPCTMYLKPHECAKELL